MYLCDIEHSRSVQQDFVDIEMFLDSYKWLGFADLYTGQGIYFNDYVLGCQVLFFIDLYINLHPISTLSCIKVTLCCP